LKNKGAARWKEGLRKTASKGEDNQKRGDVTEGRENSPEKQARFAAL